MTALFGLLVILSTGYELYRKSQADTSPSSSKVDHNNLTQNGVELNGVETISTGDLELKSRVSEEMSEATEQKATNGSTAVLVQQSNQDLACQKRKQGMYNFISWIFLY